MKKILTLILIVGALVLKFNASAQYLPETYQPILNEIVKNFDEIRGATSLNDGKSSLRLLSQEKIILKLEHKRKVKTLTFVIKLDEEGNTYWMSDNTLTNDMVNKYESVLTKELENMLEISREQAKK
jgi:hypothetical protein